MSASPASATASEVAPMSTYPSASFEAEAGMGARLRLHGGLSLSMLERWTDFRRMAAITSVATPLYLVLSQNRSGSLGLARTIMKSESRQSEGVSLSRYRKKPCLRC